MLICVLGISTNAFGGVYNYSSILKVEGIPEDVIKNTNDIVVFTY